jgi:hypothetical protein
VNVTGVLIDLPISKQLVAAEAFALVGMSSRWLENESGSHQIRHGNIGVRPVFKSFKTSGFLNERLAICLCKKLFLE